MLRSAAGTQHLPVGGGVSGGGVSDELPGTPLAFLTENMNLSARGVAFSNTYLMGRNGPLSVSSQRHAYDGSR